ncbi:hypothetical protein K466DRAFT_590993 [Polyporus arcularius HHB13444]|uniref:Uncharacterized protein n=1 Tax=Polyporus arcularius HHB13444 TaxID=1314778 RepID=A0A5C3NX26_9APHY|nr:hypothetical protein K466DRAFT_590993 [Polyporus arcularius HHB13444]
MPSVAKPPDNLVELVKHAITTHHTERKADKQEEHPSTPPLAQPPVDNPITWNRNHDQDAALSKDDAQETILHSAKEDYQKAVNGEEVRLSASRHVLQTEWRACPGLDFPQDFGVAYVRERRKSKFACLSISHVVPDDHQRYARNADV